MFAESRLWLKHIDVFSATSVIIVMTIAAIVGYHCTEMMASKNSIFPISMYMLRVHINISVILGEL